MTGGSGFRRFLLRLIVVFSDRMDDTRFVLR